MEKKENLKTNIKRIETIFYIVIWLVMFLSPFLFSSPRNGNWVMFASREWLRLLPFFLVFLINNFFLLPHFFLKKKYKIYFISCAVLILAAFFLQEFLNPIMFKMRNVVHFAQNMPAKPFQMPCPPVDSLQNACMPAPMANKFFFRPFFLSKISTLIISLLIIGFNTGFKIFVYWTEEQAQRTEAEKQHLSSELAFLKQQISPHFFMNTLNNIHALVDIDSKKAKDSIIKLSRLMRYLLYESNEDNTTLKKEIEFTESYIELVRLRYNEDKMGSDSKSMLFI